MRNHRTNEAKIRLLAKMCYILKNICLGCKETVSVKPKFCKPGTEGQVCVKMEVSDYTWAFMGVDEGGRKYMNLLEVMEVVLVENRIPSCKCGTSMDAPSFRDMKRLECGPEDELIFSDTDSVMRA